MKSLYIQTKTFKSDADEMQKNKKYIKYLVDVVYITG